MKIYHMKYQKKNIKEQYHCLLFGASFIFTCLCNIHCLFTSDNTRSLYIHRNRCKVIKQIHTLLMKPCNVVAVTDSFWACSNFISGRKFALNLSFLLRALPLGTYFRRTSQPHWQGSTMERGGAAIRKDWFQVRSHKWDVFKKTAKPKHIYSEPLWNTPYCITRTEVETNLSHWFVLPPSPVWSSVSTQVLLWFRAMYLWIWTALFWFWMAVNSRRSLTLHGGWSTYKLWFRPTRYCMWLWSCWAMSTATTTGSART